VTIIYRKCARGLNPFGIAQECGNRDTRNPELVRNRLSRQISAGKPNSRWICQEISEG
jgi:hypothetical protein